MDLYLMSPPGTTWSLRGRANFRSAHAAEVDATAARREWLTLAQAIEARGGRVAVLPPDEELTGLPFAAEAGLPLPASEAGGKPRFLLPRMKPAHRQGERTRWAPFVTELGFDPVELATGTWEGQGDVATFDDVTMMFFGGRTDREGLEAARHHVPGETLAVELRAPAFHGNMAVLSLPHAGCLVVCADLVEDDGLALMEARFGRDRMHFVSMEEAKAYATNALPIGEHLLAPGCTRPRVLSLFGGQGMRVEALPMVELCEKAGGASRCLVCVGEGLGDQLVLPEAARLDAWGSTLA